MTTETSSTLAEARDADDERHELSPEVLPWPSRPSLLVLPPEILHHIVDLVSGPAVYGGTTSLHEALLPLGLVHSKILAVCLRRLWEVSRGVASAIMDKRTGPTHLS